MHFSYVLLYVRCKKYIEDCGCEVRKRRRIEATYVSLQVAVYENPRQNICITLKKNNGCRELRRNRLSKVHTRNGFLCCSKAERFISLSPERSPNSASACWNPHGLAKNQGPAKEREEGGKMSLRFGPCYTPACLVASPVFYFGKILMRCSPKTKNVKFMVI